MHDERERDDIDERVRAVVSADADATRRVVERAFAANEAGRRMALAAAVIALAALVLVAAGLWRLRASPPLELAIRGKASWVVVTSSDGRRWIVGPRSDRLPHGSYVIVVPQ